MSKTFKAVIEVTDSSGDYDPFVCERTTLMYLIQYPPVDRDILKDMILEDARQHIPNLENADLDLDDYVSFYDDEYDYFITVSSIEYDEYDDLLNELPDNEEFLEFDDDYDTKYYRLKSTTFYK